MKGEIWRKDPPSKLPILKLTYKEPYAVAEGFKIPQVFVL